MAMIKCPECGKEISDKAAACINCGCPIEKTDIQEKEREQEDYTKIAAQQEMNDVKSRVTDGNRAAGIIAIILGITSLYFGIFGDGGLWLILGGFFFLFIGISVASSLSKDKKRIEYLQNVSDGKREILICPYCKGTNVKFDAVQSGTYTSGQTARISDNINPFRPFTHTNVKTSGTRSDIIYKTLYICGDCGKTFNNPNKLWA